MAWSDPIYRQTALIVLSVIFGSGAIVFFLRERNYYFVGAWASIKSWLFAAPLMFLAFALPYPWPLVVLALLAIYGAKAFFQILGMYHRTYFVLLCYAGIYGLALCIYLGRLDLYNLMPMMMLGACCFVPLVKNSYKQMIQYISLTLLGFIFLGWSFMHLGLLLLHTDGLYQILYVVVLTEFCDNTSLAISPYLRGGRKLVSHIDHKRTLTSTAVSVALTILLAWVMKSLLPHDAGQYWLAAGLVASVAGLLGDLVMTAVRKDTGVNHVGLFILGRGDLLRRMDRLIFVAPIYYHLMSALDKL